MTPEEIHAATDRFEQLVRTFDRTRSFREFKAEQDEIVGEMLAHADAGGEYAALVRDRFNMVASDADSAGLYRHEDDLTQDHSPADQQTYWNRSHLAAPLGEHPTEVELLGEGRWLIDEVAEWVSKYNPAERTYRQFWDDYRPQAARLEAFLQRPDLPDRVQENATIAHDVALHRGFDPESHAPTRSLDDLIRDPSRDT